MSEGDILLKSRIDKLAAAHPDRFKVCVWGGGGGACRVSWRYTGCSAPRQGLLTIAANAATTTTPPVTTIHPPIPSIQSIHPNQVHYVVDKPSWGGAFWKGSVGYVTKDILTSHLPAPATGNMVFVCGPPVSGVASLPTNNTLDPQIPPPPRPLTPHPPPHHPTPFHQKGMMAAISGDKAPDKSQGPLSGALLALGYSSEQVFKF